MRKSLSIWLVFGWFFFTQGPWEMPGEPDAKINQMVGPFKSELSCKAQRDEVIEILKQMGAKHKVSQCQYTTEA